MAHPFGEAENGLPLDAMCRTMEIGVAPHLSITPLDPRKPKDYDLS